MKTLGNPVFNVVEIVDTGQIILLSAYPLFLFFFFFFLLFLLHLAPCSKILCQGKFCRAGVCGREERSHRKVNKK